jgi:putative membrane protein
MSVVGFGLVVAALGSPTPSPATAIALMASGAAVIIIAFVRMQIVRLRLRDVLVQPDSSVLADAFLAALVIALFAMLGSFALLVTPE